MDEDFYGNNWAFGIEKDTSMEDFWVWSKSDGLDSDGYPIMGEDLCKDYEKEL